VGIRRKICLSGENETHHNSDGEDQQDR